MWGWIRKTKEVRRSIKVGIESFRWDWDFRQDWDYFYVYFDSRGGDLCVKKGVVGGTGFRLFGLGVLFHRQIPFVLLLQVFCFAVEVLVVVCRRMTISFRVFCWYCFSAISKDLSFFLLLKMIQNENYLFFYGWYNLVFSDLSLRVREVNLHCSCCLEGGACWWYWVISWHNCSWRMSWFGNW